eukprot:m.63567 g.63567  ORF g.63567 m.63567 type:complete len:256 (+) comp15843_c0_seq2:170-937(+)
MEIMSLMENFSRFPVAPLALPDAIVVVLACMTGARVFTIFQRFCVSDAYDCIDGCPRWSFAASAFLQAFVYLPLYLHAWYKSGFSLGYVSETWDAKDRSNETLIIVCVTGYLVSDALCLDPMKSYDLFIHHCTCSVVLFILTLYPTAGTVALVSGMVALEIGSVFYSLSRMYPNSTLVNVTYAVVMLASNIVALVCAYVFFHVDDGNFAARCCLGFITLVLATFRTRDMIFTINGFIKGEPFFTITRSTDLKKEL